MQNSIKDLPAAEQILPGNFLLIENDKGTYKLDFEDFVIGPDNTNFYKNIVTELLSVSSSTLKNSLSIINNTTLINTVSVQTNINTNLLNILALSTSKITSDVFFLSSAVINAIDIFNPTKIGYTNAILDIPVDSTSRTYIIPFSQLIFKSQINLEYEGYLDTGGGGIFPNTSFDLLYNWWFTQDTDDRTLTLTISTNGRYNNVIRRYTATVFGIVRN
jgi:hypothetical protein